MQRYAAKGVLKCGNEFASRTHVELIDRGKNNKIKIKKII